MSTVQPVVDPDRSAKRVIVCGSRDWTDALAITEALTETRDMMGPIVVVHGAARGADRIAGQVARKLGLPVEEYPADWNGLGKGAGPVRNRKMLDGGADLVVAFKVDFDWSLTRGGTENMVKIATLAAVPVIVHEGEYRGGRPYFRGVDPERVEITFRVPL